MCASIKWWKRLSSTPANIQIILLLSNAQWWQTANPNAQRQFAFKFVFELQTPVSVSERIQFIFRFFIVHPLAERFRSADLLNFRSDNCIAVVVTGVTVTCDARDMKERERETIHKYSNGSSANTAYCQLAFLTITYTNCGCPSSNTCAHLASVKCQMPDVL